MMMSDECPPAATSTDLQHLHQQTSVRVLNTQQQQNTGTQQSTSQNEKTLRETQTLRAIRRPSRGRRMANISSAGDGHYLHLLIQFGDDPHMQFRVIEVTDPQTHKQTNRQDRLQYTAPLSLARSVKR